MPPEFGKRDDICAIAASIGSAKSPISAHETSDAGPAASAASAGSTRIPAPMTAPIVIAVP